MALLQLTSSDVFRSWAVWLLCLPIEARAVDRRGIVDQDSLSSISPPNLVISRPNIRPPAGSYGPTLTIPRQMLSDALVKECGEMGVNYRLFAVGEFVEYAC